MWLECTARLKKCSWRHNFIKNTVLFAIGGANLHRTEEILHEFTGFLKYKRDAQVTVMTVATDSPDEAAPK
jgi:hypothetical protein